MTEIRLQPQLEGRQFSGKNFSRGFLNKPRHNFKLA
jgi:hypothetical protein